MGGRPEMRVAKEETLVVVVVVSFGFVLLLQQGGSGGGIAVVMVGMVVDDGFSSRSLEVVESGLLLACVVLASAVGGRESRTQQQGPRDLSQRHPVSWAVLDDSVNSPSQVTKILTSTSMPRARSWATASESSSETQEVQELFLTTQTNSRRRTGSRWNEARWAMSRSWGRMNVTPVEPAIKRTVSKAAKSAWDAPYGPSIRATCVCGGAMASCWVFGRRVAVGESADMRRRFVKPLCPLRMKTRSLLCEEGTEAIVAGWDWTRPSCGIFRKT